MWASPRISALIKKPAAERGTRSRGRESQHPLRSPLSLSGILGVTLLPLGRYTTGPLRGGKE